MFKNIVSQLSDTQTYGVISVCLFAAVFAAAMVCAVSMRKTFSKAMSAMPLDDGPPAKEKGDSHE